MHFSGIFSCMKYRFVAVQMTFINGFPTASRTTNVFGFKILYFAVFALALFIVCYLSIWFYLRMRPCNRLHADTYSSREFCLISWTKKVSFLPVKWIRLRLRTNVKVIIGLSFSVCVYFCFGFCFCLFLCCQISLCVTSFTLE